MGLGSGALKPGTRDVLGDPRSSQDTVGLMLDLGLRVGASLRLPLMSLLGEDMEGKHCSHGTILGIPRPHCTLLPDALLARIDSLFLRIFPICVFPHPSKISRDLNERPGLL